MLIKNVIIIIIFNNNNNNNNNNNIYNNNNNNNDNNGLYTALTKQPTQTMTRQQSLHGRRQTKTKTGERTDSIVKNSVLVFGLYVVRLGI